MLEDSIQSAVRAGLIAVAMLLSAGVISAAAEEPEPTPRTALEDWRQLGAPVWRFDSTGVEAGPDTAKGNLMSPVEYKNFRLRIEFWVADETNSGVFLRCKPPEVLEDVNPLNCYEINIWDNHPNQEARSGSIVRHVQPAVHVDTLGRWNTYEIVARGSRIEVTLNGETTAVLDDDELASGFLSLQYAGEGLLRFRNLEIEIL